VARALFGPPQESAAPGGLQVTVHLVPVFEGRLLAFDVLSKFARGRWLPWAVMEYGQNPWEGASLLADDWLDVPLDDLSLADVMSLEAPGGGWELALVFRAALSAAPAGDAERRPFLYEPAAFDAIGAFDPVDLERWVTMSTAAGQVLVSALHTPPAPPLSEPLPPPPPAKPSRLVF
jgi:hypothetical protein